MGVYNKKKKPIKKKPKTEYIMFVDETDPTATELFLFVWCYNST